MHRLSFGLGLGLRLGLLRMEQSPRSCAQDSGVNGRSAVAEASHQVYHPLGPCAHRRRLTRRREGLFRNSGRGFLVFYQSFDFFDFGFVVFEGAGFEGAGQLFQFEVIFCCGGL